MIRTTQYIAATLFAVAILVLSGAALLLNSAAIAPLQPTSIAAISARPTLTLASLATEATSIDYSPSTEVQSQSLEPTLIPPDLTVAAEIMAIPPCCDEQNVVVETMSPEQSVSATREAEASPTAVMFAGEPTYEAGEYLSPSNTWITYTEPNLGFSVSYPDNWTLLPLELAGDTRIINRPYGDGRVYGANNKERVYIAFFVRVDKEPQETLEEYLSAKLGSLYNKNPPQRLTLKQGYFALQRQVPTDGERITTIIYIEKDNLIYEIVYLDSIYEPTIQRIINSLKLPET
jgi:hypothetical protein